MNTDGSEDKRQGSEIRNQRLTVELQTLTSICVHPWFQFCIHQGMFVPSWLQNLPVSSGFRPSITFRMPRDALLGRELRVGAAHVGLHPTGIHRDADEPVALKFRGDAAHEHVERGF